MPRSLAAAGAPAPGQPFRMTGAGAVRFGAEETGSDGKPKLGTFNGIGYTGAVMTPGGWLGRIVCDLAGIKFPADKHRPIYHQHDSQQLVGHSSDLAIGPGGLEVAGVFSGQAEHVRKVTEPARNGFRWQMSIGATPIRTSWLDDGQTAEVNGRTVTGPLTISHETELGEVSFVPLGADGSTSVAVSASKGGPLMFAKVQLKFAKRQGYKAAAKFSDEEIEKMSEEEAKAALAKCQEEPEPKAKAADDDEGKKAEAEEEERKKAEAAARAAGFTATTDVGRQFQAELARQFEASRKAAADEVRRVNEITARCQKFGNQRVKLDDGQTVDLIPHAIQAGWSADQAELVGLRNNRVSAGVGGGPLVYSTTTPEASEAVIEAAVLHAARHSFKLEDDTFYSQPTPDGKGTMRRVPEYLQRQAQGELRARYTDQVQQAAHTMFRGRIGLHQIMRFAAGAWGYGRQLDLTGEHGVRDFLAAWDHYDTRRAFHADGASNVSLANVLANVMNKFALQGYLFTEQAWRDLVAIRPVNDFKPTKSINLLGDVAYKAIGPTGELSNASLGDQAFSNQAAPFGRILTLPWTHIVNDDLGMLSGAPQKIGQGAGLALNDLIWTLKAAMYAGTVNGDDGVTFYRTGSSLTAQAKRDGTAYKANRLAAGAASALSGDSLKLAKALFDNQVDPNGNPLGFDGLAPRLLYGPSNWQTVTALLQAVAIVYGGATAANAPNANVWSGAGLKPVMSRYMESPNHVNSPTAWEVLYDPVALPTVEVAFLNGKDTPDVLTAGPDYQFDRLGISVRGTMTMGATQQNFRGGVYSPGQ